MAGLPRALEALISELSKLPGIGRRSAERIAFGLLGSEVSQCRDLSAALLRLHEEVSVCAVCGFFSDAGHCPVCGDASRDPRVLCVVENSLDALAFERAGGYRGLYHVLGGVLSPLRGISPEDLTIDALRRRVEKGEVQELILATSPSVEGDATATYLADLLDRDQLEISRIGRGVPMGGSLELTDSGTLRMALEGRRRFS